jgi:hypothetical protein
MKNENIERKNDRLLQYADTALSNSAILHVPKVEVDKQQHNSTLELTIPHNVILPVNSTIINVPTMLQTNAIIMQNNTLMARLLLLENSNGCVAETSHNNDLLLDSSFLSSSKLNLDKTPSSSSSSLISTSVPTNVATTKTIQRKTSIGLIETLVTTEPPITTSTLSSQNYPVMNDNDDDFETFTIDESIFDSEQQHCTNNPIQKVTESSTENGCSNVSTEKDWDVLFNFFC